VLIAGLCRAAVMTAVAHEAVGRPMPAVSDEALVAAAAAAARHGLSGVVMDPSAGSWTPASGVLDGIVSALGDALDAAGDRQLVESLLTQRLRSGSGADRQRTLWRRGPRAAAVAALAELTADLES
jgi:carboxylate-amine ligase